MQDDLFKTKFAPGKDPYENEPKLEPGQRLGHLLYRCYICGRLLTRDEILGKWERLEAGGECDVTACPCGSRRISPANMTPEEEDMYESTWQWIRYKILRRRDHKTRIWDLYYKYVKGTLEDPYA